MFDFPTHSIPAQAWGGRGERRYDLHGDVAIAPRIAIVGSRAADLRLMPWIEAAVEEVAAADCALVSGGALGVDGIAHRHALRLGVRQQVFAGCHAASAYPPDHEGLFAAIGAAAGSGVIFCLPRDAPPCRASFASRNRLIVESCVAVVVVQAGLRSGTLRTGKLALDRGKPLLAGNSSSGGQWLIGQGACTWSMTCLDRARAEARGFIHAALGRPQLGDAPSHDRIWPADLLWLQALFAATPEHIKSLDDFAQPLLALCALQRAQSAGLVVEVAPYVYRASAS